MITYYVAASSDGFIAGKDHDLSFLEMAEGDHGYDYGYESLYGSIDICVWGKGTYDAVMKMGVFPYPEKENWILTRSKVGLGDYKEVFTQFNPGQWKTASANKNIWLVGGGITAQLFLDAGLIDKLILTTIPTVLNEGIPLFAKGFHLEQWQQEGSQSWGNGVFQVTYAKK